jgi:hypothetical protein
MDPAQDKGQKKKVSGKKEKTGNYLTMPVFELAFRKHAMRAMR